jgi:hypothetical protein
MDRCNTQGLDSKEGISLYSKSQRKSMESIPNLC